MFVKTTSLVEDEQKLAIVHRKVTEVPAVKPVKVAVGLLTKPAGIVMPLALPKMLQVPVPTEGVLAAIVKVPLLHCVCAAPATAVVGAGIFDKTTSLVVVGQIPFVIVHRKVTLCPIVKLEKVAVGLFTLPAGIVKPFAEPTMLQAPVPAVGMLAAIVKAPLLH